MHTIMDLCFLCTKDYNCVLANEKIVSQVKYLLPEITIIELGIPLRICSVCDEALYAFSKFKRSSVESSRRLEARIKEALALPLHTGNPSFEDDNEASGAKPKKIEEIFIKEEYVEQEQTALGTQMHTNRVVLDPVVLSETISAVSHHQLFKASMSQNIQLHTDTISDNKEEIYVKEEQIETQQDRKFYNSILKEECVSNSVNDDTDFQPVHKDENATLNTSAVWNGSFAYTEETVEDSNGKCSKNIQADTKTITHKSKNQDQLTKIQKKKEHWRNVCPKLFEYKSLLKKNHLRIKVLSCTFCKKLFIHKYDLNKHMDLHNGVKNFPCSICKKRFFNKSNLKQHTILHTERKENKKTAKVQIKDSVSYSVCNKELKYKNIIHRQLKIHSGVKKFQCQICEKSFTSKSALIRHIKSHYGVKDFQCEICEKSFLRKLSLTLHMKIHNGVKDFRCEICNKSFTRKAQLTSHLKIHSGVKDFQCNICEKSFTWKGALTRHIKIHSGVKDFQCDICEKSFTRQLSLTSHMKIHNGVKDFQCEICEKAFTQKLTLISHMKIHEGVKDFQCKICEKKFTWKGALIRHLKIHSGVKEFQCEICEKSFTQKYALTAHMKTHTKQKEFKCEICNKIFPFKYSLIYHMELHSGMKEFRCEVCGKSFTRKGSLTSHLKFH